MTDIRDKLRALQIDTRILNDRIAQARQVFEDEDDSLNFQLHLKRIMSNLEMQLIIAKEMWRNVT